MTHLQIHIAPHHTFFITENVIFSYSARFRRILKQYRRTQSQTRSSGSKSNGCSPIQFQIQMDDFPGGSSGFELVSRFCYNHGNITITVSNVALLHCSAVFLEMTEQVTTSNLIQQTQVFLDGIFYWPWIDIISCIQSCESFFSFADSYGLLQKLVSALLVKISSLITPSSSSSSSSSDTSASSGISTSAKLWWFDDMALLPVKIIEKVVQGMGSYGISNNSLILTRFLLHYLKTAAQSQNRSRCEYGGIADTAVHGVIQLWKNVFSCRGLFWVLRVVSGFGLSKDCRVGLERLIGGMLDQAKLDDLLISGHHKCIYDVNLVIRLIRVFVNSDGVYSLHKLKKVGKLVDKYLSEISPDQNLTISKFLGVTESLPDRGRDLFDGVYRAIDIYLESHPNLSTEEITRLCRCLNHEKLSLETCKALAKNPRVPPRIAVEALMSQSQSQSQFQSSIPTVHDHKEGSIGDGEDDDHESSGSQRKILSSSDSSFESDVVQVQENQDIKVNLQRMQWRVVELEKVCKEMKSNMSSLVRQNAVSSSPYSSAYHRALPRLC